MVPFFRILVLFLAIRFKVNFDFQLINIPAGVKDAVIRCTLVTADEDRRFPHAHHLVRKNENVDKDDPHDIKVSEDNDFTAMFCNMGIIHTAKKNIKEEIVRKRKIEILEQKKRLNYDNPTITTKEDLEVYIFQVTLQII